MSHSIKRDFGLLRTVSLLEGFTPDADWVSSGDTAGWETGSDPGWIRPGSLGGGSSGWLELVAVFSSNPTTQVPALVGTTVTVELVHHAKSRSSSVPDALIRHCPQLVLVGQEIFRGAVPSPFEYSLGARVVAIANPPVAASLAILARVS